MGNMENLVTDGTINPETLRDKFAGAMLGTAVGDALGAPVEGWGCDELNRMLDGVALLPPAERALNYAIYGAITGGDLPDGLGRYTDDTQMMIGVAESLAAQRGFDGEDMAARFADNFDHARGYGMGAQIVLKRLRDGAHWQSAADRLFGGQGSYGNGAAMRIAPVGLFYHTAEELSALRQVAEGSAGITHTHDMGREGAVLQAAAVAAAVRASTEDIFDPYRFIDDLTTIVREDAPEYLSSCNAVLSLLWDEPGPEEVSDVLGNGIEAFLSVPSAIYAFLANHDSFAGAVLFAIRLGGDTDTIGAMCGAISGAFHGASAIPKNYLAALENGARGRDYIAGLSESLFDAWAAKRAVLRGS